MFHAQIVIFTVSKMQSNDLNKRKFSTWLSLLHLLITNIKKHLEVIYTLSSIQIRRVREMTAAVEMCFGMINSLDSRWCLCHSVEPPVAMSHYPHPTNGRRRQIINLPWWWHRAYQVSLGQTEQLFSRKTKDYKIRLTVKRWFSSHCCMGPFLIKLLQPLTYEMNNTDSFTVFWLIWW